MRNSIIFVLVVASLESGCGAKLPSLKPFKMEVQQGNVVTSKMLLQLRPGMTRSQVRYIMGTPLIVDSFRDNRWDYFYELRKQGKIVEKRRVILDFDKDSLVSVRGDVIPSAENPDVKTVVETPKAKAEEPEVPWTEKLKFWKGEEAPAGEVPPAPAAVPVEEKAVSPVSEVAVEAPSAEIASPAPAAEALVAPEAAATVQAAAAEEAPVAKAAAEEVVPYIPEGEYQATAPTAEAMVKGNLAETSTPVVAEEASPVTDKGNQAKTEPAQAASPPPVFEPEALPAPVVAEPEPVLPPPVSKPAPVALAQAASASATSKDERSQTVATASTGEAKPVAPVAAVADSEEVIPYIPEGEYQGPGPTPEQMVMGNTEETDAQAVEASTQTVTEKGVAPKVAANVADPVFVAEQLPESAPEAEPVVPPAAVKPEPAAKTLPATLAATPVAETAVSAQAPAGDADIHAAVAGWAQAWRSKDVGRYLSAYATDFVPEGLPNKKAWEAQRKQRLSAKQGDITLVLKNIQVQRNGNAATVQFEQKYAAKAYSDELLKTLQLRYVPEQKRWLISRERVAALGGVVGSVSSATVVHTEAPVAPAAVAMAAPAVESAIQAWAQAWRSKDVDAYLAAYAPDFMPEGLSSRKVWEAQRKQRLSPKQGAITLEISQLDVQQEGNEATVVFTQKYASKVYRDQMVKKLELRLEPAQGAWLIVRETVASPAALASKAGAIEKADTASGAKPAEPAESAQDQIGF